MPIWIFPLIRPLLLQEKSEVLVENVQYLAVQNWKHSFLYKHEVKLEKCRSPHFAIAIVF
jgi:hypothetical protein